MNELTIQLDLKVRLHLYEQIYEYIKNEIVEGRLAQGERLPSTRALCQYLEVSRSTVTLAYEQLIAEGYIESKPYKGYYVSDISDLYQIDTHREKKQHIKEVKKKYNCMFASTGVEMREFPFGTWKKITKEILIDEKAELFTLGSAQGDIELRTTINQYLYGSRGVNCTPEQIVVGAGNDYLLMLLQLLLNKQAVVAFENPTYKKAYHMFQTNGFKVETIPMDESGIRVDILHKSGADIAYIMPSHQYPTGTIMPIGRRREMLQWARGKQGRYIIEDDYDSEFRYKGKPVPSLQASDTEGNVIYIGTFSKSIAPAIRVSYMVLPESLLEIYKEQLFFISSTVSRIDQMILNEFIRRGAFERYLNKMRKIYKNKHDVLLNGLKIFKNKFIIRGEYGGLHVLLESQTDISEVELCERAEQVGVKVFPLSDYKIAKLENDKPTIILGYASLSEEQIIEGLKKLAEVWL